METHIVCPMLHPEDFGCGEIAACFISSYLCGNCISYPPNRIKKALLVTHSQVQIRYSFGFSFQFGGITNSEINIHPAYENNTSAIIMMKLNCSFSMHH